MADTKPHLVQDGAADFTPVSLKHHISWKGAPGSEIGDPIEKKSHEEVAGSPMELETELQKWERVLVGKQFVLDTEADAPLQFTPEDDSVKLPETKRFILKETEDSYNRKRLSICLDMQYRVKSVYFG